MSGLADVRSETPSDISAVRAVLLDAFEGSYEADVVDLLREDATSYLPDLSLVATVKGSPVGHVISTRAIFDRAPLVVLGPIGVIRSWQKQGIGTALMEASIQAARESDFAGIVLIGHPSYYPRFGFQPLGTFGLTVPIDVPADVEMGLELRPGSLAGLSGTVGYPAAFGMP